MSLPNASESSGTLSICLSRLDAAEKAYLKANDAFASIKNNKKVDDKIYDRRYEERKEQLIRSLGTICDVARFASQPGQLLPEDLTRLVERAAAIEDTLIELSYGDDGEGNSTIACGNVLKDKATESMGGMLGLGSAKFMVRMHMSMYKNSGTEISEKEVRQSILGYSATPYKETPKPSLYTSPLARFGIDPVLLSPSASPATIAFAEARCEIQSNEVNRPVTMRLVGDTLVVLGAGGYKEQSGLLSIRNLSSGGDGSDFDYSEKTYSLGRKGGSELAVDDSRKLVYNGGSKDVNAYRYGPKQKVDEDVGMDESEGTLAGKGKGARAASRDSEDEDLDDEYDEDDDMFFDGENGQDKLAFSLKTNGFEGALGLTADGAKVLRTGKKGLGVWDVSSRGVFDEPRFSSVESKAFSNVAAWKEHPSDAQRRLVAGSNHSHFVSSVDIETGGISSRYVGHSMQVTTFATSKDDPNGFITASYDGGVRFYDSRLPAPIYAIEHSLEENLQSVLYEHIGGHPFIIIGGYKSQQIKVWDARGRAPLYELSTGNNVVEALAWDGSRNQLFAATDCESLGYHGTAFDYREADFGDEDYDEEMAWPEKGYHDEQSFGYPFDCGSHRLLRYSFKTEPDTKVLPEYGQAQPDRGGGYGGFW